MQEHEVTPEQFREALGRFATGVTVITALDDEGGLHGLTANAFSSLSLSPPLVLACVSHEARCLPVIQQGSQLTVHILTADQGDVAKGFARKGGDRSGICAWQVNQRGFPILERYAVALECRLREVYPGGDHAILVLQVLRIHGAEERAQPLLYYRGQLMPLASGCTG